MQTVKRLADLCIEVLIHSATKPEHLYGLSAVELVELSSRLLHECRVAREGCQAAKQKLAELQSIPRYFVDPPRCQDRCDQEMYDRQESIRDKWEVTDDPPTDYGNRSPGRLVPAWDSERQRVYYAVERTLAWEDRLQGCFSRLISSPLLLYRLWCTFKISRVQEGDGYKCIWLYWLKHKESGFRVGFREHKVAVMAHARSPPTNTSFDLDYLDLLNLLLDPMCPHTYDGCVAGSVA